MDAWPTGGGRGEAGGLEVAGAVNILSERPAVSTSTLCRCTCVQHGESSMSQAKEREGAGRCDRW